jgi:hypothetical protein
MKAKHIIPVAAAICAATLSAATQAGTIENLERERSITLEALLSADLTPDEREERIGLSKTRLVDLERMVLRDEGLRGKSTPTVRAAFENYDLTFLVHASTEKNVSAIDAWLAEIGITTQSLMSAKMGRR